MDTADNDLRPTAERPVTMRALVVACLLTAAFSAAGGLGASYLLLGEGDAGPRGAIGQQGEPGPAGEEGPVADSAAVDEEAVWGVVEGDPARAAALVQDELDPTTSDVADEVSTVTDDVSGLTDEVNGLTDQVGTVTSGLDDLCSSLSLAAALSSEILTCP